MKVAICFIGTGKYLNFLPKYYQHIQEYFLPNSEKTFLVFTDGELNGLPSNVIPYYQEHLSWPFITLNRFEFIKRAESEIKKNDWFIFIDADALVVDDIKEEEFFDESKPFFGVHHPCHFLKMNPHTQFPGALETNPESNAYVKEFKDFQYIFKVVYGVVKFLKLLIWLRNLIEERKKIYQKILLLSGMMKVI